MARRKTTQIQTSDPRVKAIDPDKHPAGLIQRTPCMRCGKVGVSLGLVTPIELKNGSHLIFWICLGPDGCYAELS